MTKFGIHHLLFKDLCIFYNIRYPIIKIYKYLGIRLNFTPCLILQGVQSELLATAQTSFFNQPVNLIILKTVVLPSQFFLANII